jgi:hypothetical protein
MADLDALCFLGDGRGKFLVDAFFDQEARGRRAALAVERVDHEDGGVSRAFQIGIAEYDNRILAAELEVHPLERICALLHDQRSGAAFADKADRFDVGMFGQSLAGVLAHAVDEIPHTRRQTRRLGNLHQKPRG